MRSSLSVHLCALSALIIVSCEAPEPPQLESDSVSGSEFAESDGALAVKA